MSIKGFLFDITGVLYESGAHNAIKGSVEAINRLKTKGIPYRFVTNETQHTRPDLATKLRKLSFDISEKEIFSPAPAVRKIIDDDKLRPFLIIHPSLRGEFEGCDTNNPNCVVLGDAAQDFTYQAMDQAFKLLLTKKVRLLTMGKGKFYQEKGELTLDLGPFAAGLEYAADVQAEVIGKPSPVYFNMALTDLGLQPEQVAMVGDDILSDVGGAQAINMKGVLVRTGKYRPDNENHSRVKPDAIVDNLAAAVELYFGK